LFFVFSVFVAVDVSTLCSGAALGATEAFFGALPLAS
jgi:hypothetical protein